MAKLYNAVKMTVSGTPSTGTVTLGSASASSFTFAEAGVANAEVVAYRIDDGSDFEIGIGTYTSSGTTLSRDTVTKSKIAGVAGTTKLTLTSGAIVRIVARKEDLLSVSETQTANTLFSGPASGAAAAPAFRAVVAADLPAGSVVDSASATYATNADLTATIPLDDTIPQSSEGTQILSVSITPKSTSNKIRIHACGWGVNTVSEGTTFAIFSSVAGANAIQAGEFAGAFVNTNFQGFSAMVEESPATLSAVTYTVRVGPSSTGTMRLNGTSGAREFGGASKAYILVEEIKV